MSRLADLRSRLGTLRQRRSAVRWGTGWSALATALLWVLAAAFLVDFLLEMSRLQRVVSLLICGGVAYWAYRRYTAPFLGVRETDLDMALLVERRQQIDSDLVAALEFETPASDRWGSRQLQTAVIEYVADFGNSLDVFQGMDHAQLRRRFTTAAVTGAVCLLAIVIAPSHAAAFFNRLFLGSAHYPTRTQIREIAINDQVVESKSAELRSPYGKALRFAVRVGGEIPANGRLELFTRNSRLETKLTLEKTGAEVDGVQVFRTELPRLLDDVDYQIYLGDAWTDPQVIHVTPLPQVALDLEVTPPSYAHQTAQAEEESSGARRIAVIEGSRVDLAVVCSNKPLVKATLTIEDKVYELQAAPDDQQRWTFADDNHPFAHVVEPIKYQVQVEDRDGLVLETPLQGFVGLKPDQPPRIAAEVVSNKVLPNAKPKILFGATDDFGLARVRVRQTIRRGNGLTDEKVIDVLNVPPAKQPVTRLDKQRYTLNLSTWKLEKGDEIQIFLEAIDYRGAAEGKVAQSESVILEVTDVQGFLAGMVESDEQSARRLDAIIQRQLGIGDSK